jgi:aryl sulfotransferase
MRKCACRGGFPPFGIDRPFTSSQQIVDLAVTVSDFYFGHMKAWWRVRHLPNVHMLHFSTLSSDPRGTIQEIAQFLEIPLNTALLDTIVRKTQHSYMHERGGKYKIRIGYPGHEFEAAEGDHIRKGGGFADGGNDFLTPGQDAQFESVLQHEFGVMPALLKWSINGSA